MKKRGFTLIELIIVVTIIAILSSIAYISLSGETAQARDSKRKADLKTLENAISMSNAQNRSLTYPSTTITTGDGTPSFNTTSGAVHVLRNASAFEIGSGFINSTILATVERDPKGAPYLGAFINSNQFQLIATLENPTTQRKQALIVGSFKEDAIVDNILTSIDNDDTLIPVANAGQFIRGDILQIDNEKMKIADITTDSGVAGDYEAIIVCRGYNTSTATCDGTGAAVHQNRESVKLTSFASNASSLFCVGALTTLAKSAANASVSPPNVPTGLSLTLANVTYENMFTCSSTGNVTNEGNVVVYDVSL